MGRMDTFWKEPQSGMKIFLLSRGVWKGDEWGVGGAVWVPCTRHSLHMGSTGGNTSHSHSRSYWKQDLSFTRSLGPLPGQTSIWQSFGVALGPSDLLDFVLCAITRANTNTRANTITRVFFTEQQKEESCILGVGEGKWPQKAMTSTCHSSCVPGGRILHILLLTLLKARIKKF